MSANAPMTPERACLILRAYVVAYDHNKLGRPAPDKSRLLALDALAVLQATAAGMGRP